MLLPKLDHIRKVNLLSGKVTSMANIVSLISGGFGCKHNLATKHCIIESATIRQHNEGNAILGFAHGFSFLNIRTLDIAETILAISSLQAIFITRSFIGSDYE
jgi:hypothetical protein